MQVISDTADGMTVGLGVGQTVEVRLAENASTGFRWEMRQDGKPACRVVDEAREPPKSGAAMPGQEGTHSWRLVGVQPGECEVAMEYRRPWENSGTRQFSVRIRVAP